MIDQILDAAGFKLKLAEFSLQFIQLGTLFAIPNSIHDGIVARQGACLR